MVHLGLSWNYGEIISGLRTVRVIHFEMYPSINYLCVCVCVCREHVLGVITLFMSLGRF